MENAPVLLISQEKQPSKDELNDPNDLKLLLETNKSVRDTFLAVIIPL
jgi:uncharacterized membrane protein